MDLIMVPPGYRTASAVATLLFTIFKTFSTFGLSFLENRDLTSCRGLHKKTSMVRLSSKNIKDIKQISSEITHAIDVDELRLRITDLVHKAFNATSTIFWMIDHKNRLIDPVLKDIQDQYLLPYKNYFFDHNPFDPRNIPSFQQPSVLMEQLTPLGRFHNSEYYNDFLKPQNIHRQMAVYIRRNNKMAAVIGMHRSAKTSFGKTGLFMGDMISHFLSAGFERMRLLKSIEKEKSLTRMIKKNSSVGMLLLDHRLAYVYSNPLANEICRSLCKRFPGVTGKSDAPFDIPGVIIDRCKTLNASSLLFHEEQVPGYETENYKITWQSTRIQLSDNAGQGFIISLVRNPASPDNGYLRQQFDLTPREIEIISHIARGRTNRQIAQALFISPGTVKNHLKHIFTKTGAANRTCLAHIALQGSS